MTVVGMPIGGSEVNGIIAVGVTERPDIQSGEWVLLQIEAGVVIGASAIQPDPPVLAPTVARLDEVGSPKMDTILLRVAGTREAWANVGQGRVVEVMDRGELAMDGDEAVFIRYMTNLLDVLRGAARLLA